jgi:TRAP-type transport system small permease protein
MKNKLGKLFLIIDKTFESIIVLAFVMMISVGLAQVFSRYALRNSLSWSEEFQKFMHIWIIFLAIPLAYKNDAHIGMNILYKKFPLKMQRVIKIIIDLLWLLFGVISTIYSLNIMKIASGQKSPGLGVSMSLVYCCIFIGGAYMILMAGRKLCSAFFTNTEPEAIE